MSARFFIFHHDPVLLEREAGAVTDHPDVSAVDLRTVPLPPELVISGMDEADNRAVFSEYLGILSVDADADMVGCFTYSIPAKFSFAWAGQTGLSDTFLPEIRFEDIVRCSYRSGHLYAAELNDPGDIDPEMVSRLCRDTGGPETLPPQGPFKGSFVVDGKTFRDMQAWLLKACERAVTLAGDDSSFGAGRFTGSAISGKTRSETRERLRHGLGALVERGLAAWLGDRMKGRMKRLGPFLARNSKADTFEEVLARRARNGWITTAAANSRYRLTLHNWLHAAQTAGVRNIVVIALDKTLARELAAMNIAHVYVPWRGGFGKLWELRVKTVGRMLDAGYGVIHSDTDAIWLKDAAPLMAGGDDLVISAGTVWPRDVHEHWGFVLCCGLFGVRPTTAAKAFFSRLAERVRKDKDDQVALNRLLHEEGLGFTPEDGYTLDYRGTPVTYSREPMTGTAGELKVRVMPHHLVQRIHMPDEAAVVKHLVSPKTDAGSFDVMRAAGCMALDAPVSPPAGFIGKLRRKLPGRTT